MAAATPFGLVDSIQVTDAEWVIPETSSGVIVDPPCDDDTACEAGFELDGFRYNHSCDPIDVTQIVDEDYATGRYNGADLTARRIAGDPRGLAVTRPDGWSDCGLGREWIRFGR